MGFWVLGNICCLVIATDGLSSQKSCKMCEMNQGDKGGKKESRTLQEQMSRGHQHLQRLEFMGWFHWLCSLKQELQQWLDCPSLLDQLNLPFTEELRSRSPSSRKPSLATLYPNWIRTPALIARHYFPLEHYYNL